MKERWEQDFMAETGQNAAEFHTLTPDGLAVHPLYDASHLRTWEPGWPGQYPYTRGIRASMYMQRPWTIRQYAGFSTAEETNAFYRAALAAGQTGLSVAFDLATHRGYDSDHPRVAGDVGKAGVAIDSVEDVARLFAGIPLTSTSVSMTMNGAVLPVLAAFIVAAEEQGAKRASLSGTLQNDILKEFMVRNTFIYPPAPSLRIVADIIAFSTAELPKFNPISISGYHMHEAGATAIQELAYTLADGLEYVRAATQRGLAVDAVAPRLSFFFAIGMDFFTEIAKLRAARTLWAQCMRDRLGARDPKSWLLRTHCQTSGVSLTEADAHNNIIRTAYEALAAVLGGTQSLHTNSFDEALALPSDFAARLARNTQLILQHETGITRTVDPLGGSWYIEGLTRDLVTAAGAEIDEIEAAGGMTQAVIAGLPKARIEQAAARRQARLDSGEQVVVGVNRFQPSHEEPVSVRQIDTASVRQQQISRLDALRAQRDGAAVAAALAALRAAAADDQAALMPVCIAAMRARATVGEVSAALEETFGRYQPPIQLQTGAYGAAAGEEFRTVAALVEQYQGRHGRPPHVFIAKLGQDGHDRGAKVVASALSDMGFAVTLGPLFQTPAEAAASIDTPIDVVAISSLAAGHLTLVPEMISALRARGLRLPVIVGGVIPPQDYAALQAAGVAAIFGPGTPIPASGREILRLLDPSLINEPASLRGVGRP